MKPTVIFLLAVMLPAAAAAADYTYTTEGFEDPAWVTRAATVKAPTGTWTANKNTSSEAERYAGERSLLISEKTGIVTPRLTLGAARLTYRALDSNRQVYVETSTDGTTWTEAEAYKETSGWKLHTVDINSADVRYIRLRTTSNNNLYIDNFLVTAPGAVAPEVTTAFVTDVTNSTATVVISASGEGIVDKGACWSLTDDDPDLENGATTVMARGDSVYLTSLPADCSIAVRAFAANPGGVAYGNVIRFTTAPATLPAAEIASVTVDSLRLDGKNVYVDVLSRITDFGGVEITEAGIEVSSPAMPEPVFVKGRLDGSHTSFITSLCLLPETSYTLTPRVTNLVGTSRGAVCNYATPRIATSVYAHNTIYCDPTGSDATADGSALLPFFSLQNAVDIACPGDTIIMRAGTYSYSRRINIGSSGEPGDGYIVITSEDGRAVLDFSAQTVADANQGIRLTGSYWHLYGLDICNAGDNGLLIERNKPSGGSYTDIAARTGEAHDNIIENCEFYRNADTGLQMKNLAARNAVINCDSYYNADPDHGDADGFAVKISHGDGNYFYGCRAWANSDDGWDQYIKKEGGFPDDITTTLDYCFAFENGYLEDGQKSRGNGNGFKMGSNQGRNNVILNRCVAFNNLSKGFDQNHNTGHMILNNCSGYAAKDPDASRYSYRIEEPVAEGHIIRLTNCVAISDGISDKKKSAYAPWAVSGTLISCEMNTLPSDYVTIDDVSVYASRLPDGNLPDIDFMRPADGNTRLIDAGVEVDPFDGESYRSYGITYAGEAPDLGYIETGQNTSLPGVIADTEAASTCLSVVRTRGNLALINIAGASPADIFEATSYSIDGRLTARGTIHGATGAIRLPAGAAVITVTAPGFKASTKLR